MATKTARARAVQKAKTKPLVAAGEVKVHSQNLTRLVREGTLERVARGRYRLAAQPVTEHHSFAVVAAVAPNAVICLLSALTFHRVGTQVPFEVWIAIGSTSRSPVIPTVRMRVARFSGQAFSAGVEFHRIEGQQVRIYSIAKTIADLFKFRKKIGIDVALEALRDAWQRRLITIDEIDRYARICRVTRVMRPYLEALTA